MVRRFCQGGYLQGSKNLCNSGDGRVWNFGVFPGLDNDLSRVLTVAIRVLLKLDTVSPWLFG